MKNVYFINAHPDDLNGGLALALILSEHPEHYRIHVVDFTRGERGLSEQNVSYDECGAIRTREETAVCAGLGVVPSFLGQINGAAFVTPEVCENLAKLFRKDRPDVIFTHFPADNHTDHVLCAAAVLKTLDLQNLTPEVYFYRQNRQSRCMVPDRYLAFDERIMSRKCELLKLYECQNGTEIAARQRIEDRFNGFRCNVPFAECYTSFQYPLAGEESFFGELDRLRNDQPEHLK